MDQAGTIPPSQPPGWRGELPVPPAEDPRESRRRTLLRRLFVLLITGTTAFGLTTWTLVRFDGALNPFGITSGPAAVVKAHLDALNRGELRTAYGFFSKEYRGKVPFEAYHELVVSHWSMFRTRELRLERDDERGERAVLEAHLLVEEGRRYVAQFTLVRAEGRWWIDDVHWGAERDNGDRIRVQSQPSKTYAAFKCVPILPPRAIDTIRLAT